MPSPLWPAPLCCPHSPGPTFPSATDSERAELSLPLSCHLGQLSRLPKVVRGKQGRVLHYNPSHFMAGEGSKGTSSSTLSPSEEAHPHPCHQGQLNGAVHTGCRASSIVMPGQGTGPTLLSATDGTRCGSAPQPMGGRPVLPSP